MTVDQIISTGRDVAHVNSSQVSDTNALKYLNVVYHDLLSGIRQNVGEDFFFDDWTDDAVVGRARGEYTLKEVDNANGKPGIGKIKGLRVKTADSDVYWTKATQVDVRSLNWDWDWYLANQPRSEPIYWLGDNSLFIAPQFDATLTPSGVDALKLYGLKREIDLLSGGAEGTILVPREYHSTLALGLKAWCEKHVGKNGDGTNSDVAYQNDKLRVLDELSDRDNSLGQASLPDDTQLQY